MLQSGLLELKIEAATEPARPFSKRESLKRNFSQMSLSSEDVENDQIAGILDFDMQNHKPESVSKRQSKAIVKAERREYRLEGITKSDHIEDLNYFLYANFNVEQILKNYSILQVELLRLKLTQQSSGSLNHLVQESIIPLIKYAYVRQQMAELVYGGRGKE